MIFLEKFSEAAGKGIMQQYPVFAYGNLSFRKIQEMIGDAPPVSPALLRGYRVVFTGCSPRYGFGGTADLVTDNESSVMGMLYEWTDKQRTLWDAVESVQGAAMYRWYVKEVELPTGARTRALVHSKCQPAAELPPHMSYLRDHQDLAFNAYVKFVQARRPEESGERLLEPDRILLSGLRGL